MMKSTRCSCLVGSFMIVLGCGSTQTPSAQPVTSPQPDGQARVATVEEVLDEYRSSPEWKQSRDAYREIMRKHVHGHSKEWTDAELDEDFETFVTLSQDQFDNFLETQSCLDDNAALEARYYSVRAVHDRHDAYVARPSPHPPAGTGSEHVRAAFSANLLLERFHVNPASALPPRAAMKDGWFASFKDIANTMTNREKFDKLFLFLDPRQADSVFQFTSKLDWDSKVSGEVFVAPSLHKGQVFSPAIFATYVFRADEHSKYSVYVVIAATGKGVPAHPYIGLVDNAASSLDGSSNNSSESKDGGEFTYRSKMRIVFDALSTAENLLKYRVAVESESPLIFALDMTTAYPDHPDHPYITIKSRFAPTLEDKKLHRYLKSPATKVMEMVRKGALLKDLFEVYYPGSSQAELWNDVEAIRRHKGFKAKLEATGLDLCTDLFARGVWLQKPTKNGPETKEPTNKVYQPYEQPPCPSNP